MKNSFREALAHRRSHYAITNSSPISDDVIIDIVESSIRNVPSAFNSQSSRAVVLLGHNHLKLWDIVIASLEKIVPAETIESTRTRIASFAAGYATVLFFEDQSVIKTLQASFPLYAENFPVWSEQCSGMNQLAVWTMLDEQGLGVSLQHYNPLIDDLVHQEWKLPQEWKLRAQMPMGLPVDTPQEKTFQPITDRVKVFK